MATGSTEVRIAYLEPIDLDEAYQISLDAFRQDAHTLFKMHEKGNSDMQSEMLPQEEIRSYLDRPEKVKVIKATVENRIVGFSIWGLWNWEGQNKEVRTELGVYLTQLTCARNRQSVLEPRCPTLSQRRTLRRRLLSSNWNPPPQVTCPLLWTALASQYIPPYTASVYMSTLNLKVWGSEQRWFSGRHILQIRITLLVGLI